MSEVLYRGPRLGSLVAYFAPGLAEALPAEVVGYTTDAVHLHVKGPGLLMFVNDVPQRTRIGVPEAACWDWPGNLGTAYPMPPTPPPDFALEPLGDDADAVGPPPAPMPPPGAPA